MSDRDREIDELMDREAIRQLPARYCHLVRLRDVEAILDLYSDDCQFEVPASMMGSGVKTGKEAIEETFRTNLPKMDPWPFTHNHVIDLKGPDRAIGYVYTEFRSGTQNYRVTNIGVYEDEYVKERGQWKFRSRKLSSVAIPE